MTTPRKLWANLDPQAIRTAMEWAPAGTISERERRVLNSYFGLTGPREPIRQIGERLGITVERVGGIRNRALHKLATVVINQFVMGKK